MRIVITGGGTGGHIYPALALVKEIKRIAPESEFLYIGTEKGLESDIVPREGIPFQTIEITGFKRKLSLDNAKTIWRFINGTSKAKKMIKEFKADIVIGTGGYVAGPVVYAGAKLNIPCIIHEQNSVPGLTNKFLSRYAEKVGIAFQEAASFFPSKKVEFVGNPRASEVANHSPVNPLASLDLQPGRKTVLIVGGSRGAKPINEAFLGSLNETAGHDWQYLYVTGSVHYDNVMEKVKEAGNPENVSIQPFLHNMPDVLHHVDLIVTRAGATTIAEITALGLPAVLIPSPYVTNNHQEKNALALEVNGAAVLRKEKDITSEVLMQDIQSILSEENKWKEMKEASLSLGVPDASSRLYKLMDSLIRSNK